MSTHIPKCKYVKMYLHICKIYVNDLTGNRWGTAFAVLFFREQNVL